MTVGQERWPRLTGALATRPGPDRPLTPGLCSACVTTLSVAGAAITLIAGAGVQVVVCASDAAISRMAELEFTLGIGPAGDAHECGVPVLETDLVKRPPSRWAAFTGPAVDAGIRAVFAFPLRLGAARLGSLTLYDIHPGEMGPDAYADALVAADIITRIVLTGRAGMPEEALMAELTDERAYHAEVHQASGMVSIQLGIGVGDALARLRARAFAVDQPIGKIAADVVARRLRFDE